MGQRLHRATQRICRCGGLLLTLRVRAIPVDDWSANVDRAFGGCSLHGSHDHAWAGSVGAQGHAGTDAAWRTCRLCQQRTLWSAGVLAGAAHHRFPAGGDEEALVLLLDEFDLETVGVFDKRDHGAAVLHRTGFTRDHAATLLHAFAGRMGIVDFNRDVTITGADLVAINAPVVREFEHGAIVLALVADEGEGELAVRIILAAQQFHVEHAGVETNRTIKITDAKHGVEDSHYVSQLIVMVLEPGRRVTRSG